MKVSDSKIAGVKIVEPQVSCYSSDMRKHLETFCRLAPNAERPLAVHSGETHADVAVNFTDVQG